MYDRVRESWNQLPNMLQVRQGAGCGVSGKHVVVFGGYDGTDDWINSTEIFNLDSWSWFQGQLTPYQLTSHNILQYGMDSLLAFGGTIVNGVTGKPKVEFRRILRTGMAKDDICNF